jgi:ribonucleoside-triphosphate reductase
MKYAYLFAKTVTLRSLHWAETTRVVLRNRRIGTSVTGIAQFLSKHNMDTLRKWLDKSYNEIRKWDDIYSDWFCVPRSIKVTAIKPSGSLSLLAGCTPGAHFPESKYYIRRVRVANSSHLIPDLKQKGFKVEPCVGSEDTTSVVEIPIYIGNVKTIDDVTMWEQLEVAAFLQNYYADNQVSCTVTFDPETEGQHIAAALNTYQYRLKGISFLPRFKGSTAYPQMPYEKISKEQYDS